MDIYGLVGKKLSHSFSPDYFNKKFQKMGINAEYRIFELSDVDELPELLANNPNIRGLNITIPYKQSLGSYVDFISKNARLTGAINTIKVKNNKKGKLLLGYNTDVVGFEKTIKPLLKSKKCITALILGIGGSAKSVAYVLRKQGVLFKFVSRNYAKEMQINYEWLNQEMIQNNLLIINTTPVGMFPNNNASPTIPYEFLTANHILYDLVYNPAETQFLSKGRKQGCTCINGQKMLEIQAEASWKLWHK